LKPRDFSSRRLAFFLCFFACLVGLVVLWLAFGSGQLAAGAPPTAGQINIPASGSSGPVCLVGRWEITNLKSALVDTWVTHDSPLTVDKIEGAVLYTFSPDGRLEISFDRLSVQMSGVVDDQRVEAENKLDGSAWARYEVDAVLREIHLSDFGGNGIDFQLEMNGQALTSGNFPAWQAFTSAVNGGENAEADTGTGPSRVVESARATFSCETGSLTIQALEPQPGERIEFTRVD